MGCCGRGGDRGHFPPAVLGAAAVGGAAGGITGHLAGGMSRAQAKQLGDFIDPGQAGLVIVGESKVEDAIKNSVAGREKQTAQELGVDPEDIDKALQQAVDGCNPEPPPAGARRRATARPW